MQTNKDLDRLKKVLLGDTIQVKSGLVKILKEDMFKLLSAYFDLKKEGLELDVTADEHGIFNLICRAKAENIKNVKVLE